MVVGHLVSASGSSRLDQAHVIVWVKVEDGGRSRYPTSLNGSRTSTIAHIIDTALDKEKVDIAPGLVTVEFKELEIRRDRLVTEFDTSYENPLLLKCPEGI